MDVDELEEAVLGLATVAVSACAAAVGADFQRRVKALALAFLTLWIRALLETTVRRVAVTAAGRKNAFIVVLGVDVNVGLDEKRNGLRFDPLQIL